MFIEIEGHIINLDEVLYVNNECIHKEYIYIFFKNNTKISINCNDENSALNVYDELLIKLNKKNHLVI